MTDEDVASMKDQFETKMREFYSNKSFSGPWTEEYVRYIKKLLQSKNLSTSESELFQKYVNGKYHLAKPKQSTDKRIMLVRAFSTPEVVVSLPVLPWERAFDVVWSNHVQCGHGNVGETMNVLKRKYYIDIPCVYYMVQLCCICNRYVNVNEIETNLVYNQIGSLEILDMSSKPDGDYKYILIYTDVGTGLVQLRAVANTIAVHLATKLIDIFTDLGAPKTLRIYDTFFIYDFAIELVNKFLEPCKITLEPMLPSGNQVEKIQSLVAQWMTEENTEHWEIGCYMLQWIINNTATLDKTKHQLVFERNVPTSDIKSMDIESSICDPLETTDQTIPPNQSTIEKHEFDELGICLSDIHHIKDESNPEPTCVNVYDDMIVKDEDTFTDNNVESEKLNTKNTQSHTQKIYYNKKLLKDHVPNAKC